MLLGVSVDKLIDFLVGTPSPFAALAVILYDLL